MNKQTCILVGFAVVLAILYIVGFTDWLKHKDIHIISRFSPANGGMVFYLDKPYPLTSIKVVEEDEAKTNKFPHALWHLISSNGPAKSSAFAYGSAVPGMQPEISTALPEKLQPDVNYSMIVEAGAGVKGQETFKLH